MFRDLKISAKIIWLVLSVVILAVVSEGVISYSRHKSSIKTHLLTELELLLNFHEHKINQYFHEINDNMNFIVHENIFVESFQALEKYTHTSPDTAMLWRVYLNDEILNPFQRIKKFEDIYLLNNEGEIVFQHSDLQVSGSRFHNIDNQLVDFYKQNFHVNKPIKEKKSFYIYLTIPIIDREGKRKGTLVCKLNENQILQHIKFKNFDMGKTVEVFAYKLHKKEVHRLGKSSLDERLFFEPSSKDPIYLSSFRNPTSDGKGYYTDSHGKGTLAVWKHLDVLGIGMMAKIDQSEAEYLETDFNFYTIFTAVIILVVSVFLSIYFSRLLISPILRLKKVLTLVSKGVLPKELKSPLKDEIGEMIEIVNNIVKSLKNTAAFANRIGEGDFYTSFQPLSQKDTLGHALLAMRDSLKKADDKDMLRNWIVTGVAEIGEILRRNDTLSTMGDQILEYICQRTNSVQGAFYTVNDEDENDVFIEMKASYAYQKRKYLKATFRFAEGLVGQAAAEKDVILRTEIPSDYMHVTSGLIGDQKPTCVLLVPLITNEKVYGVLELAGFHKFNQGEIQYMNELSEIIARTIFNIQVNERTRRLLEESQRMSSELQIQQAELRQNAIEMESTQEVLRDTNVRLEDQINEVNNAQKRLQALLENASEVIIIYEKDGTVRYVSPSVERILGYKQNDLMGIQDVRFIDDAEQAVFKQMFEELLDDQSKQITVQVSYYRKTGDKIWLEATGKNMIQDPAIQGIVVNYRDITERRRAEEEQSKRGQMQALSENSPDLITRISGKGKIFYINPTITTLTGLTPSDLINKSLSETKLHERIVQFWTAIAQRTIETRTTQTEEVDFPSINGDRIVRINAIPEIGADQRVDTVLVVSHDITEEKQRENEIVASNKKINDSINYAERIQEAILPDNALIRYSLPQSFIYFKPRDVVSGDFPWFMRKGDHIYIAVVDCTGHGVPGALISIVGYFLLNGIVEGREGESPAEILNYLDKAVTDTFKQNLESSKIKDGMDISLCKIDMINNYVEYSGAKRPLYLVSPEGSITEYKGDNFPIGGGKAYGEKNSFTNHSLKVGSGDSIYIFSDGLPDQFGADGTKKFGPKRIQGILENTAKLPIEEVKNEMDRQLLAWQGDIHQTDDILMIGVRF